MPFISKSFSICAIFLGSSRTRNDHSFQRLNHQQPFSQPRPPNTQQQTSVRENASLPHHHHPPPPLPPHSNHPSPRHRLPPGPGLLPYLRRRLTLLKPLDRNRRRIRHLEPRERRQLRPLQHRRPIRPLLRRAPALLRPIPREQRHHGSCFRHQQCYRLKHCCCHQYAYLVSGFDCELWCCRPPIDTSHGSRHGRCGGLRSGYLAVKQEETCKDIYALAPPLRKWGCPFKRLQISSHGAVKRGFVPRNISTFGIWLHESTTPSVTRGSSCCVGYYARVPMIEKRSDLVPHRNHKNQQFRTSI